ncbi:MAG: hypothetical protein JW955_23945 [Sedimentisphaerales bacterium]|nr:hypothetical protein [Sedimentisphaerales bacterium]
MAADEWIWLSLRRTCQGGVALGALFLGGCVEPASGEAIVSEQSSLINAVQGFVNVALDCPGVVADGCHDDGPGINACLVAHPGDRFYFPKTRPAGQVDYFSSETIEVAARQTLEGAGNGDNNGTVISLMPPSACGSQSGSQIWSSVPGMILSAGSGVRDLVIRGTADCGALHSQFPVDAGESTADGIRLYGFCRLDNVFVCGFGRDGIHAGPIGTDVTSLTSVHSEMNLRHGFYYGGGPDAQAGSCTSCNAMKNQGYGIVDESWYGNTFVGAHTNANIGGSILTGPSTGAVFISAYVEGNQHYAQFGKNTLVIGPLTNTIDYSTMPPIIDAQHGAVATTQLQSREIVPATAQFPARPSRQIFGTGTPNVWGGTRSAMYVESVTDDEAINGLMALGRSDHDGLWCWRGLWFERADHVESGLCVEDWYTAGATPYQPRARFPHGFRIGGATGGGNTQSNNITVDMVHDTPPSGTCDPAIDGIRFNNNPTAGDWLGWVCAVVGPGNAGAWKRFGAIEP